MLAIPSLLNTQAVSDQSEWFLPKVPSSGYGILSLKNKSGTSQTCMHTCTNTDTAQKYTVATMIQPHYQLGLSYLLLGSTNKPQGTLLKPHVQMETLGPER